jgi:fructose-bisphosphate aldolase class I
MTRKDMNDTLQDIAAKMVAPGQGILAADESTGTIKKRFDSINVESTADTRRDYREMLFRSDDAMKNHISGVILFDETLRQSANDGTPLVDLLKASGSVPGIKVDAGAKDMAGHPGEKVTEGLDGLRERLAEYHDLGARFAKWRGVIDIAGHMPSWGCIKANAHALARYAALCQEAGIVPIVEPEVLMDGPDASHDIERCFHVTRWTLQTVFSELAEARVSLEGMVLKPNMVIAGKNAEKQASAEEVAAMTVRCLKANRAQRRAGHRVPVRRAVRRTGHPSPVPDEPARPALGPDLLLWPRPAGRSPEGLGRQGRKRSRRAGRLHPPRPHERPCGQGRMVQHAGKSRLTGTPPSDTTRTENDAAGPIIGPRR